MNKRPISEMTAQAARVLQAREKGGSIALDDPADLACHVLALAEALERSQQPLPVLGGIMTAYRAMVALKRLAADPARDADEREALAWAIGRVEELAAVRTPAGESAEIEWVNGCGWRERPAADGRETLGDDE